VVLPDGKSFIVSSKQLNNKHSNEHL
jgi:hypothetical protein